MSAIDDAHTPELLRLRGDNDALISRILGRPEVSERTVGPARLIEGRRVLVTGAGGSIGSELCRQVARLEPSSLLMLDRDESALHAVKLGISGTATMDTPDLVLADLRDAKRLRRVFDDARPEVVLHAGALKHVPLLERNPSEAWKTNVIGTLNVLALADEHETGTLINISTDKAANAVNVLGQSKRIAERLTSAVSSASTRRWVSVRFGNVLGTRGSLLETFLAQIESGSPITVTDPRMTRYFMTVQEAVHLVLEAGGLQMSRACMVLDMGQPMSIDGLAHQLVKWSGKHVEIRYTGLRAGEKLTEALFDDTEVPRPSEHPAIAVVDIPALDWDVVRAIDPDSDDATMRRALATLSDRS